MHSVWNLSICNLFLSKFFCIHENVQMTPKQCKRSSGNFQKLLKMTKTPEDCKSYTIAVIMWEK